MVYSNYTKLRILFYHFKGYRAPTIARLLEAENIPCMRENVRRFIIKYNETRSIARSGRPSRVTAETKAIVKEQMWKDDETTALQLHKLLVSRGYRIRRRTVLRCRTSLGWTFQGSAYCQLIREANKAKRLRWAEAHLGDTFDNVIWTDECTVQIESHRRFCCRKLGEAPKRKPR